MILTKELEWQPTAKGLAWAKLTLGILKSGGVWHSSNGACIVNHEKKTVTLIAKTPCFDSVVYDKVKRTFEAVGYAMIDVTEVKCDQER